MSITVWAIIAVIAVVVLVIILKLVILTSLMKRERVRNVRQQTDATHDDEEVDDAVKPRRERQQ